MLEQAVANGLGVYSGSKYDIINEDKREEFGLFTTYEINIKKDVKVQSFNAPFYSEYKGLKIGNTYV